MQTLNIFDKKIAEYSYLGPVSQQHIEDDHAKRGLALLEQLQTTLDINKLLNIFAMEAAKYVDFAGLYFQANDLKFAIRGSKSAKAERRFELKVHNQFIGNITYAINSPISLSNYKIIEELHQYLVHPLHNALQYQQALQLAMEDALTGLGNRRYFDEQLSRAMKHADRQQTQVGLILADLNKFKPINDVHGHDIGDRVLKHFADALKLSVRDSDSVFRFGGDEFAILVECASGQALNQIEHRIKHALSQDALLTKYKVSCSLGKTFMDRADTEKSFFKRADNALYRNKMGNTTPLSIVSL
ncbi:GGDEF domain-containing protein [Endozoicomonas sp. G2_1]|uniref:GGDEF domain-containing protein n=1 Tax=Endozoicomonas sp. G2_1 TaxID=2821091 RepID=UPI001AD95B74|nr:GGDEF domain-containing protein [Endozoicomonas sp. G2_1]MBO9491938.1 GGDEF domain-containing protein [Endozoicomonas sp. G2_1]